MAPAVGSMTAGSSVPGDAAGLDLGLDGHGSFLLIVEWMIAAIGCRRSVPVDGAGLDLGLDFHFFLLLRGVMGCGLL